MSRNGGYDSHTYHCSSICAEFCIHDIEHNEAATYLFFLACNDRISCFIKILFDDDNLNYVKLAHPVTVECPQPTSKEGLRKSCRNWVAKYAVDCGDLGMRQANLGLDLTTKRTRKREFLDEMNRVVPWGKLVALITPHAPEGKRGRPPFPLETMLRIHFMQQWFSLSDPAMEEALHDVPLFREFAALDNWNMRLPDESTILRFRHLLEKHELALQMLAVVNAVLSSKGLMLKAGTAIDATLIPAPSSTKNASGERDPEMSSTKKGNQWYFGALLCWTNAS